MIRKDHRDRMTTVYWNIFYCIEPVLRTEHLAPHNAPIDELRRRDDLMKITHMKTIAVLRWLSAEELLPIDLRIGDEQGAELPPF